MGGGKKEEKGAASTSGGIGWRKLTPIIDDLTKISAEFGKDEKQMKELDDMDAFDRAKRKLNEDLAEIKKSIEQINDMKRGLPEGDRDLNLIKLQSDTRKKLKECSETWNTMKKALDKELAKGAKSKVPREKLEARGQMLSLMGNEIVDFNSRLSTVKEIKSTVELGVVAARNSEKKRGGRRGGRRARNGGGDDGGTAGNEAAEDNGEEDSEFEGVGAPSSVAQLQFAERKEAAYAEQDEFLTVISAGLDDLKHMGLAINRELKLQSNILVAEEQQIVVVTEKIATQNSKMQELIDASGGASRWCPILICVIVLLALLGYIFKMI